MSKQGSASKWNGGRARVDENMVTDDRFVKKDGRRIRVQDEVSESDWIERRRSPKGFHRGARVRS